jgi:hypothetical protein
MPSTRFVTALLFCLGTLLSARTVAAQIDHPNSHVEYAVELEPHLVVQWDGPWWGGDGFGVGGRASIPLIQNGPVRTINNSLALGVGLDWAHFSDNCGPGPGPGPYFNCSANTLWVPVVIQWNFFFSDLISAFPELGLAVHHDWWSDAYCQGPRGATYYCGNYSTTDLDLAFWLGVRFHLAPKFALTLRLGTPSLLLGASFLL